MCPPGAACAPEAEEATGWHVAGDCGHLVVVRHDHWVAPCPTCDKPDTNSAEVHDPAPAQVLAGADVHGLAGMDVAVNVLSGYQWQLVYE